MLMAFLGPQPFQGERLPHRDLAVCALRAGTELQRFAGRPAKQSCPRRSSEYRASQASIRFQRNVDAGHHFFGDVSKGLASIVERAVGQWGQPNGYILGEEAGGAFIGGLRYGDGTLYTKDAGDLRVFWQ